MAFEEKEPVYTLTYRDVVDLLKIIDESSCQELHLELNELRLDVVRGRQCAPVPPAGSASPPVPAASPRVQTPAEPEAKPPVTEGRVEGAGEDKAVAAAPVGEVAPGVGFNLQSPLSGMFYRAPAPGAAPFVEVGSSVEPGDQVAIVEIMKLMNSIKAPLKGIVRAILVENETAVTMGQTLMVIEPV
jgi:acetyl-CoA carboxylase biotin carboxyl carrier protein